MELNQSYCFMVCDVSDRYIEIKWEFDEIWNLAFFSRFREGGGGEIQLKFMKGIVKVILSDPPCKEENARFTTVHLNQLYLIVILRLKVFHSDDSFMFSCRRNAHVTFSYKRPMKIYLFFKTDNTLIYNSYLISYTTGTPLISLHEGVIWNYAYRQTWIEFDFDLD